MGINARGVVIGNEAVFSRWKAARDGVLGMDILRLALEEAATAREAVDFNRGLHGEAEAGRQRRIKRKALLPVTGGPPAETPCRRGSCHVTAHPTTLPSSGTSAPPYNLSKTGAAIILLLRRHTQGAKSTPSGVTV